MAELCAQTARPDCTTAAAAHGLPPTVCVRSCKHSCRHARPLTWPTPRTNKPSSPSDATVARLVHTAAAPLPTKLPSAAAMVLLLLLLPLMSFWLKPTSRLLIKQVWGEVNTHEAGAWYYVVVPCSRRRPALSRV